MTSKWIKDVIRIFLHNPVGKDWVKLKEKLERIDKLLRSAAFSTDDENLHDEILKEIKEEK